MEEAKKHQGSDDKDEIEAAAKALNEAIMPIGAKMYEQAAKESENSETDEKSDEKDDKKKSSKKKAEEAVEGEVVDEDKKEV